MIEAIDFGFIFSRVVNFYGFDYRATRQMPVRTFWMFHRNIDRLQAEDDLRHAELHLRLQASGEDATAEIRKLFDSLVKKMKRPIRVAKATQPEELDRNALQDLKLNG